MKSIPEHSTENTFVTRNSVAVAHVVAQCTNRCTRRQSAEACRQQMTRKPSPASLCCGPSLLPEQVGDPFWILGYSQHHHAVLELREITAVAQALTKITRGNPQVHISFLARPIGFLGIEAEKLYLAVVKFHRLPQSASVIYFQQPAQVRRPDRKRMARTRTHSCNSIICS